MAKSDRDQRGRRHSGKSCPEAQNGGCCYCRTGEYKRSARRTERHRQHRHITEQLAGEGTRR